jgi:hypothetical protein
MNSLPLTRYGARGFGVRCRYEKRVAADRLRTRCIYGLEAVCQVVAANGRETKPDAKPAGERGADTRSAISFADGSNVK